MNKQEILNMFPKNMDFHIGMNSGEISVFVVSSSRESANRFMLKIKTMCETNHKLEKYDVAENKILIRCVDGSTCLWMNPDNNIRGYRFRSIIIDLDNVDFTQEEWLRIQANAMCGRDKIRFFDEV